jgi:predicted transcriptional regulator
MRYRSRTEIISEILNAANGGDATMTRIMYKALLGYNQLKEHRVLLTEKDLLRYEGTTGTFKTTQKGLQFLQISNHIEQMMK